MSTDHAVTNPGPTGWGRYDTDSEQRRLYEEKIVQEQLENIQPNFVARQDVPGPMNETFIAKVHDELLKDGVEEGFSGRYVELAAFGSFLVWLAQIIGSCVASGGGRALSRRMLIDILIYGNMEELFGRVITGKENLSAFMPYNYRAGRKLAGINGNSDGSLCGPHTQGMSQFGFIPCSTPGLNSDAFPEPQNTATYRTWGATDVLLNQFLPVGKKCTLVESEDITNVDDMMEVINEMFKQCMICSSWAFEPSHQHPTWKLRDGTPVWIYKRNTRTTWYHNMTVDGFFKVSGAWFVVIDNSWGPNAHKNGSFFVIPIEVMVQWIKTAQVRTIGNLNWTSSSPIVWIS